jgi:phosphonate transport system substrate-binding protein
MPKRYALFAAAALICLLAGCAAGGSTSGSSSAGAEPPRLEELRVEVSKTDGNLEALAAALPTLPEQLRGALHAQGVTVDRVRVTVGSSCAATCDALKAGGVDVAFLPADAFAASTGGTAILADARTFQGVDSDQPVDWNGHYSGSVRDAGTRALICVSSTDYGRSLASRAAPTWDELNHARWGVLSADSLGGYRCAELWLEDHYEGNGLSDLSSVTTYPSPEALLTAAQKGEIDVFSIGTDQRTDFPDAGIFSRTGVLAVTDRLYSCVAAAGNTELEKNRDFAPALAAAVRQICAENGAMTPVFGTDSFTVIRNSDLDGLRRLLSAGR